MAQAHSTTTTSSYYYWLAALGVVLLALVAGVGVFFVESVPNSVVSAPMELRSSLDGDANNDGNADSMADPLVVRGASARPL